MQNPSTFAALLTASLLIPAPYLGAATARPTLVITYPTAKVVATKAQLTVTGKTMDKVAVTNVLYQLNGGTNWFSAISTNKWTNWTAQVTLIPGSNSIAAFAVDTDGNHSLTNTVKFSYAVTAPLTVRVAEIGTAVPGTVTPNYNGKLLTIGAKYMITAKPDKGFAFVDWTGSVSTNKATISFVMKSNLTFTANFKETTAPVLIVSSPAVHQTVTSALLTVTGKTMDYVGVRNVSYQLNNGGWQPASTTNDWTNWTAQVTLTSAANVVAAYAQDGAGLSSKTNSVSFTYKSGETAGVAPASLSGMTATVSPASDTNSFMVTFGASTFSETMLPGTNQDENAVGTYAYHKLTTSTALLTLTTSVPPGKTNQNVVALTFTDSASASYSSTNSGGGSSTGSVVLATAKVLSPTSAPVGKTFTSIDSLGATNTIVYTSSTEVTFTQLSTGTVEGGTYTAEQYSPLGGLVTVNFTTPATAEGAVGYIIFTYSKADEGSFFQVNVLPNGEGEETDYGTFTEK
jgi:hypothetical protein